jgi:hypothetical protein
MNSQGFYSDHASTLQSTSRLVRGQWSAVIRRVSNDRDAEGGWSSTRCSPGLPNLRLSESIEDAANLPSCSSRPHSTETQIMTFSTSEIWTFDQSSGNGRVAHDVAYRQSLVQSGSMAISDQILVLGMNPCWRNESPVTQSCRKASRQLVIMRGCLSDHFGTIQNEICLTAYSRLGARSLTECNA